MDKKIKMAKRIFSVEREVNTAVLNENWNYFEWFDDIDYYVKNGKFDGVKIRLTSPKFSSVAVYIDTKERELVAYHDDDILTQPANDYVCDKIHDLYMRDFYFDYDLCKSGKGA